jgi:putative restriction endonuclease
MQVGKIKMENLEGLLERLSDRHRSALRWFIERAGTNQHWPKPLSDGTLLVMKPKGIYKPQWSEYALSVRQTLGGPYNDMSPVIRSDDTWSFSYFQENSDPADRDLAYTNRALLACWRDKVPVGVMRQVSVSPQVYYHVYGLALVANWEGGYFFLEGFSPNGYSHGSGPEAEIEMITTEYRASLDTFNPNDILDGRRRIISSVVQRQGQSEFRQRLLDIYKGRCAISGCSVVQVLEAAHIMPYLGPHTNHLSNGLLLRADLHTLFDLGLLAVDTKTMTVIVSPQLENTPYSELLSVQIYLPKEKSFVPSKEALDKQREWAGL